MFPLYLVKRKAALLFARSNYLIRALEEIKLNLSQASHRIASPASMLVIEGPPRCGNSSALRLVVRNNPAYRKCVATHIHRSFQIYYAIQYDVPAVVMLRAPEASTISHASLLCQLGQVKVATSKKREQLLKLCIEEYLAFTQNVYDLGFRHIISFEEYVRDNRSLIDYLNTEFSLGLKLDKQYPNEDNAEAVHVFPSDERNKLKDQFSEILEHSAELKQRLQDAQYYYEKLIAQRVSHDG